MHNVFNNSAPPLENAKNWGLSIGFITLALKALEGFKAGEGILDLPITLGIITYALVALKDLGAYCLQSRKELTALKQQVEQLRAEH